MDNRVLGDPVTPEFELANYPFYRLIRLASRYNSLIEQRLRTIDLDIPSWRVLMILGEKSPRGVREIAQKAVIPLSTMTRIVQRMEMAGLVSLAAASYDARVTEVTITEDGAARLVKARELSSPVYNQAIRGFTKTDFDRFLSLIGRMHGNLGE
ncbi:MarR family winged helix-turn-helix transcriptional regulator [Novosphingobium sp. 9]|uniref:MarR family winged helix-turn-helix transcriptional regulator n=1 Tax=Novosphingobium sp. 9 TaxID=2025349 RepID=UPI0021B687E1|nr:MarR family winged helix-turn-helix transcriptional regulator [Novosphingobium sp. 9]